MHLYMFACQCACMHTCTHWCIPFMKISEAMEQHFRSALFPHRVARGHWNCKDTKTFNSVWMWKPLKIKLKLYKTWALQRFLQSVWVLHTTIVLHSVSNGAVGGPPFLSDTVQPTSRQLWLSLQVEALEETLSDWLQWPPRAPKHHIRGYIHICIKKDYTEQLKKCSPWQQISIVLTIQSRLNTCSCEQLHMPDMYSLNNLNSSGTIFLGIHTFLCGRVICDTTEA